VRRQRRPLIYIALVVVALGAALLVISNESRAHRRSTGRPNILIILTDDQSIGTMTKQVMPNTLREIADQGRRYTNFYITDPLCCPSRSSIMTGQLNHNNHVTGNSAATFDLNMDTTLQHYLHQAGYQTWISGKFLNGWKYTPGSPNPPDWDRFTVTRGGRHLHLDFNQDGRFYTYPTYADPLIERQALNYIADTESSDSKPWFGYLALTVPHGPYTPMTPYKHIALRVRKPTPSERERNISDKWPGYAEHARYGFVSKTWLAQLRMLRQADDIVGRVIAQLKSQNELGNTIIVFLSDNGFLFRSHQLDGKRLPYTESVKVPAMIRWSGHIPADSVWKRPVTNVDLAPTLLDAAGVAPSPAPLFDGRNIFDDDMHRNQVLLEQWHEPGHNRRAWQPTWASLRARTWQYIEYYDAGGAVTFREYYNLTRDPWELHSTIAATQGQGSPRIAALHQQLAAARTCAGAGCP
jgi:arylsulfatase A-like enzyme